MLKIEIVPWLYPNASELELKIKVQLPNGEEVNYSKVLHPDLFKSTWERAIDEAKLLIKNHADEMLEVNDD